MSKGIRAVLLLATVTFCMPAVLRAEAADIAKLKKEVAELRALVNKLTQAGATGAAVAGKSAVTSSTGLEIYGYAKLDASYDTGLTNGNFAQTASTASTDDNQFNMTARQTRLGMNVTGPAESSGKVEIDFYNAGAAENRSAPHMRHAYMKVDLDSGLSILAGQTSDVISPLVPGTLNYIVGWRAGNIGYRRPQVRLTKGLELSSDIDCQLQVAATRTLGGEDAGFPTLQARTSFTFPSISGKDATLGVSGHWGQQEAQTSDTWSLNVDLAMPISDTLTIKGEAFTGANVSSYLGGPAAGTSLGAREVQVTGGWLAASVGPFGSWRLNLGATIDDPDNDDVVAGHTTNSSIFGNAIYSINSSTSVGLELSRWDTDYHGPDADIFRTQMSFIYKF